MEQTNRRKSPRYQGYDYGNAGIYFITICTKNRIPILSRIVGTGVGRANNACSQFVSTFKRFCTKEYGGNIWQARFYDHIIRNPEDYEAHLQYIDENPVKWCIDELYTAEQLKHI